MNDTDIAALIAGPLGTAIDELLAGQPEIARDYNQVFQGDPVAVQWLASAEPPAPAATEPPAAARNQTPDPADLRSLQWVTLEHRGQLDELDEVAGDWQGWLPGTLRLHWPDWENETPQTMTERLEGLIPTLVLQGIPDITDEEFERIFLIREGEQESDEAWAAFTAAVESGDLVISS